MLLSLTTLDWGCKHFSLAPLVLESCLGVPRSKAGLPSLPSSVGWSLRFVCFSMTTMLLSLTTLDWVCKHFSLAALVLESSLPCLSSHPSSPSTSAPPRCTAWSLLAGLGDPPDSEGVPALKFGLTSNSQSTLDPSTPPSFSGCGH